MAPDRFYKLIIPADGNYTITLDWSSGSDIDLFVCPEAGVATFDCDFTAATGNKPESAGRPDGGHLLPGGRGLRRRCRRFRRLADLATRSGGVTRGHYAHAT